MSSIVDLIKYICVRYPHSSDLSNARLTKIVYLVDWEHSRKYGCQLTDIEWYFNNYGPYVSDVLDVAQKEPDIDVVNARTIYGTPKTLIKYIGPLGELGLNDNSVEVVNGVIDDTKLMYWNDFIEYVYKTYPIRSSSKFSVLNLVKLANAEKRQLNDWLE